MYAMSRKLKLSKKKTNYVVFSNLSANRKPFIRIQGDPVTRVSDAKYLGLIMDEKFYITCDPHHGQGKKYIPLPRRFTYYNWGDLEKLQTPLMTIPIPSILIIFYGV